jgi:hypothetical protein
MKVRLVFQELVQHPRHFLVLMQESGQYSSYIHIAIVFDVLVQAADDCFVVSR